MNKQRKIVMTITYNELGAIIDTKAEPQTLCEDCKYRNTEECPMYYEEWVSRDYDGYIESDIVVHDRTLDEGFCDRGEGGYR